MKRNLTAILNDVLQILRDEFDPATAREWKPDEVNTHISACVLELSKASPVRAFEPVLTVAESKLLDISSLSDLIRVHHIEYPVGGSPRKDHGVNVIDNGTIEIDADVQPEADGVSGALTGTITFTSGSKTVTGSSTAFTSELAVDYYIRKSTGTRWYRVAAIASDTSLTLDEAVKPEDTGADTASVTAYRGNVALVYYDTVHVLTDIKSTLNPVEEWVLVLGVCGNAAISRSRSLINTVNDGGGDVSSKMQSWGVAKMQLYRRELAAFPARIKKRYPMS
ncbi:MAG: hypothetical protein PHG35_03330 [Dehalococcoidales bacterium]|nr:hypothetical protein [Dehalococcoidales bacterium]